MVNVNVNFNGRDYLLACEEGQEEDQGVDQQAGHTSVAAR